MVRLTGISSMATRQVLAGLAPECAAAVGAELVIESVGGVDAVSMKYRLYIHQGTAEEGKVQQAFDAYMADVKG